MNEDYRIPLKCPFSGTTIFDSEGYHEPFPVTLICYYKDGVEYLLHSLDVIEDITAKIQDIEFYYKKKYSKQFKNIIKKFPWIETPILYPSADSIISTHPFVKTEVDQNEYHSMNSGVYAFYFALASNHKTILDDYANLYEELLMIEERLKNK